MGVRPAPIDQLSLPVAADLAPSTVPARLRPMQPTAAAAPFDDPEYFFEPWWPGAQALLYVHGGRLNVQIDHLADPLAAFPALTEVTRQLDGDGLIVEGTLLLLDEDGRPNAELLRRRLADPASPLGFRGEPAFVAADLLWEGGRAVTARPFEERRSRLAHRLTEGERCVLSRGLRGEGTTLAEAVAAMGIREISARRLDARYRVGTAGDEWLRLPVSETPAPETRPLLALLQRLPL